MTSTQHPQRTPILQRRAVGNLLRLSDTCLQDTRLLLKSGSHTNVATLIRVAIARMVEAILISEDCQAISSAAEGSQPLDDENQVKAGLMSQEACLHQDTPLLPNGKLWEMLDRAGLQDCIDQAAASLAELTEHFDVDLASEDPAGSLKPMRPDPVSAVASRPVRRAEQNSREKSRSKSKAAVSEGLNNGEVDRDLRPETPVPLQPVRDAAIQPSSRSSGTSSVVFWSLMDQWDVADLDALVLLGRSSSLTKKGTRPRFKLNSAETDMLIRLQDIDNALSSARLAPREWLWKPIATAPFLGAAPLAFIKQNGLPGVRDVSRYVMQQSLRLSLIKQCKLP